MSENIVRKWSAAGLLDGLSDDGKRLATALELEGHAQFLLENSKTLDESWFEQRITEMAQRGAFRD